MSQPPPTDLSRLIADLSRPEAYGPGPEQVEVRQTHISVVFLTWGHAYKIKKPVDLGFLDFTTLEQRRHFCEQEVLLNRRLAPHVYQGVVPVTEENGRLRVGGAGEPIEWAVKMVRLPDEATLLSRLKRGELGEPEFKSLARRLARFHKEAARDGRISSFGRFDVVARNARENFEQSGAQVGVAVSLKVFDRLVRLNEQTLFTLREPIEKRAQAGIPCDSHGDLHLDHIYLFPEKEPPDDLTIIDCIEFNERFRYADPVADMAFLVMDLRLRGRRDLAHAFAGTYFAASGDEEGRRLLSFYTAYRSLVRAKVEGMELAEVEIPEEEKARALSKARAHWLLALGELEAPGRRPCLVLVFGLPGTGKTTLARVLSEKAGFEVIRSDTIRKKLAGLSSGDSGAAGFGEGIYTKGWTRKTYAECLSRAEAILLEGGRVIVDANFRSEDQRRPFLDLAAALAVPVLLLHCTTPSEEIRKRLAARASADTKDASDAGWAVYEKAAAAWEEPGAPSAPWTREVATGDGPEKAAERALAILKQEGLG